MKYSDSSVNFLKNIKKSLVYNFMYHYLTIILGVIMFILVGIVIIANFFVYKEKQELLMDRTQEIARSIDYYLSKNNHEGLYRYMMLADKLADADIWIFDTDSDIIAATAFSRIKSRVTKNLEQDDKIPSEILNNSPLLFNVTNEELGEDFTNIIKKVNEGASFSGTVYQKYYDEHLIVAATPYYETSSGKLGTVMLTVPVVYYDEFLNRIYLVVLCAFFASIFLAIYFTSDISKRIVLPIIEMKNFATKLAQGKYGEQIQLEERTEIQELAQALNSLSMDLHKYTEKIEKQEKVRKDFLANISHEFKTPIAIIRGYNDALADGVVRDREQKVKYRSLINDETVRLEYMVKELLTMSRLESSNPWDLDEIHPVVLTELCRTVMERLGIKCIENNVTIKLSAAEDYQVLGNGEQLLHLILILMDNALKYSPQNGILLVCVYKTEDGCIALSVSDEGPGIPEEDLDLIWERFYMVDKSRNRKLVQGTGLGLAIAKQIIRIHGAQARVYSKLGEGTRFEIKFPKDKII